MTDSRRSKRSWEPEIFQGGNMFRLTRSLSHVLVGVLSVSLSLTPISLAEPPVHFDPNPNHIPIPDRPVIDPEQSSPKLFQIIWGLSPATPTTLVLMGESSDHVTYSIRVLDSTGLELEDGVFTIAQRFDAPNLSSAATSTITAAAANTPLSDDALETAVFTAAGFLVGSNASRNVVMIGATITSEALPGERLHVTTVFFPLTVQNTLALALSTAASTASSLDAVTMARGDECSLNAEQLAQLSCDERAAYNRFCNYESCRQTAADCGLGASAAYLLAMTACLGTTVGYAICAGLVTAGWLTTLALCDRDLQRCRNDANRTYNSSLADCGAVAEQ